ncbi:MAG TPA: PIG-L family deacetylase, partial [Opitutales bacterium]|nr:PIG-L family deacetylase [Opitutales bacterium]
PRPAADAPVALIFSPHPDDEVITGVLPLRLQHEAGARVVNIAVTLGSNKSRREPRRRELANACALLGWELEVLGWTNVTPVAARRDPDLFRERILKIIKLVERWQPQWIFYPHAHDAHDAHRGVSQLVTAALNDRHAAAPPWRIQTEYWRPHPNPNLLVECPPDSLALLIAALCCHQGEIARNPYHLTLPAWMADNMRRGAELVGAVGAPAPDFKFGVIYRVEPALPPGWAAMIPASMALAI